LINFPSFATDINVEKKRPKVFVIQQVRFKPPPPKQEQQIPKPKAKKVPIPDPTPDEPEPIRLPKQEEELDIPDVDDLVIAIPEAPPAVDTGPIFVTGDVQKPVKITEVQPQYTEIARKARIQGVVILQTIIDKEGNITDVKVLKALPMGLAEAAVSAVKQWKYEPATLNGKPVAVYFNLTVNFQLQ
jgi:TonB family protein